MGSTEVRRASAFAPAHVTGLFVPDLQSSDPRGRGSRGAGLVLELGATAAAEVTPGIRARLRVVDTGGTRLPITEEAARHLVPRGAGAVTVRVRHDLPGGSGVRHERGRDARGIPRAGADALPPGTTGPRNSPSRRPVGGRRARGSPGNPRWGAGGASGRRSTAVGGRGSPPSPPATSGRGGRPARALSGAPRSVEVLASSGVRGGTRPRPIGNPAHVGFVLNRQRAVHRPARVGAPTVARGAPRSSRARGAGRPGDVRTELLRARP